MWWWGQTVLMTPILSVKLIKDCQILLNNENINIQIYCILNAEVNIILLHWNKQHLKRGIIQWECRLLNKNFYLFLMFTCVGSMQICISPGLNVKHWAARSSFWYRINQHLPSKQTSALGGKAYPYNGLLKFRSTCSSAFWRLTSSSWSMS